MKKKILITGSNSYVGSEIIKYLSKYKYNLIASYKNKKKKFNSKRIKFIKIDLKKKINLKEQFDILIHCAAATPANDNRENYKTVNVNGFKNLIQLSYKLGCKKIFLISSIAVYGNAKKPLSIKTICLGKSRYAKSKLRMEKILINFSKNKKINSSILRLSQVVGKNSVNNYFSEIVNKIKKNKKTTIFLQPENSIFNNLCHVDDLCQNLKRLIEVKKNLKRIEIFNFSSYETTSINNLKKKLVSMNNKIIFEKSKIYKFYEIIFNKRNRYDLKFKNTINVINSVLK